MAGVREDKEIFNELLSVTIFQQSIEGGARSPWLFYENPSRNWQLATIISKKT